MLVQHDILWVKFKGHGLKSVHGHRRKNVAKVVGVTVSECSIVLYHHTTTTVVQPFSRDHSGEPVPEENFWTLWCKGSLTEADTPTIWLGATPSGLSRGHLDHPP